MVARKWLVTFWQIKCSLHNENIMMVDGFHSESFAWWLCRHKSRVSCQKGPTRHAYAWQIGPFWQDTIEISSYWLRDSIKIYLTVPSNNTGSCGIIASLDRRVCNDTWLMSTSSMSTRPSLISIIRNNANMVEDLPLPVRPQTPIWNLIES